MRSKQRYPSVVYTYEFGVESYHLKLIHQQSGHSESESAVAGRAQHHQDLVLLVHLEGVNAYVREQSLG